ncbi:MAG: ScbR family autoregulator-binding transcription factor [Actinomycetota bacterium]
MAASRNYSTRHNILVAAAEAFARSGYDSVNVNDVVVSIGLTKGALYHSFSSKSGLAREIVNLYSASWTALIDRLLAEHRNELEAVVAISYCVAGAFQDDPILRAGIRLSSDPSLFHDEAPPYLGRIDRVAGILQAGQRNGYVRVDVDPTSVAWMLVALFTGAQALPAAIAGERELTQRLDTFWELIRPSLAA